MTPAAGQGAHPSVRTCHTSGPRQRERSRCDCQRIRPSIDSARSAERSRLTCSSRTKAVGSGGSSPAGPRGSGDDAPHPIEEGGHLVDYVMSGEGLYVIDGPNWLMDTATVKPALILMAIWKGLGYSMLLYLAAIQSVPRSLYEAASLDGLSVQYASATGTGSFGATATQLTELPDVEIQPGQYVIDDYDFKAPGNDLQVVRRPENQPRTRSSASFVIM